MINALIFASFVVGLGVYCWRVQDLEDRIERLEQDLKRLRKQIEVT